MLEGDGPVLIGERDRDIKIPGDAVSSVWTSPGIMGCQAGDDIRGESRIVSTGIGLASEDVDESLRENHERLKSKRSAARRCSGSVRIRKRAGVRRQLELLGVTGGDQSTFALRATVGMLRAPRRFAWLAIRSSSGL